MWLSTRSTFREGDAGWIKYLAFIGLPWLKEVRTLDAGLNEYVGERGSREVRSLEAAREALRVLPRPSPGREYHLLVLDAQNEQILADAVGCRLLGYDLSDETRTSSLLNCGPWTGQLEQLTARLNEYGLLNYGDAIFAKSLLPREWPGEPHADVTIWALYELVLYDQ